MDVERLRQTVVQLEQTIALHREQQENLTSEYEARLDEATQEVKQMRQKLVQAVETTLLEEEAWASEEKEKLVKTYESLLEHARKECETLRRNLVEANLQKTSLEQQVISLQSVINLPETDVAAHPGKRHRS